MPPPQDALKWKQFEDWTGGLWERGDDRECPPNGLLELRDYIPMPAGGLRAAFRWEKIVDATGEATRFGLPPTGRVVEGFDIFRNDAGSGFPIRRYLALANQSTAIPGPVKIYGSTNSVTTQQSSFVMIAGMSSVSAIGRYSPIKFVNFFSTGSTAGTSLSSASTMTTAAPADRIRQFPFTTASTTPGSTISSAGAGVGMIRQYFHFFDGTDAGVYRILDNGSGVDRRITAEEAFFLVVHQNRLLAVAPITSTNVYVQFRMKAIYGDVLTDANFGISTNQFLVAPQFPGDIAHMESFMPGDLAVLERQTGWFSIQGDLSSPLSQYQRQATNVHESGFLTWACPTPDGLAYLTASEGVWAYTGGQQPQWLSPSFTATPMADAVLADPAPVQTPPLSLGFLGRLAFGGSWLFTPKGYVRDTRTGAWFVSTPLFTFPQWPFLVYDSGGGYIYAARNTSAGAVQILGTSINEASMLRSLTGSFTLPFWDLPLDARLVGSRTMLKEMQLHLQTFAPGSTVTVTVSWQDPSGAQQSAQQAPITLGPAGNYNVKLNLGGPGALVSDWFKVRVATQAPSVEAPMVQRVRLGYLETTPYA